jgi:tetratricopeptide (TPR) repeat protein
MSSQHATAPPTRFSLGFLGPVAVGVVLIVAAFVVATIFTRGGGKSDPLKEAIAQAEEQVRTDPNNAELRVAVADVYLKAGRTDDALSQYHEALNIDPNREDAIYGLGLAEKDKGDLNAAGAALQTVIQMNTGKEGAALNPRLQGAHYYLGQVLREQGRYDDAINEFRSALAINRSDADTLFELGKTFALNGDNDQASQAFDVALAFVPDFQEAYVEVEKLANTMGDQARADYARAMLMVLDGKAKDAVPILQQSAESGGNAHYYWGLGWALEKTGDKDGAMAAYQKAVDIDPGEQMAAESLRRLQAGG